MRAIRIILAMLFFLGTTLLFLDFTGVIQGYLGWMAKVQLLPAILALNVVVVAVLAVVTLLMGRIYCSVICPLGVYQDVVSWLWGRTSKKRRTRFHRVANPRSTMVIRVAFLACFVILAVGGLMGLAAVIAPYSAYGRMAQNLFQPLYIWGNNLLAGIAEHYESYAFYSVDVWMRALPVFLTALVFWVIVTLFAIQGGRRYCNTVCPVGTVLGFLSRFSWLKVRIDADKCKHCGMCEKTCKAQAIAITSLKDMKAGQNIVGTNGIQLDYTRCVDCFDCLGACKFDALHFGVSKGRKVDNSMNRKIDNSKNRKFEESMSQKVEESKDQKVEEKVDTSLRSFLIAAGTLAAGAALAQEKKKKDGGFAVIEEKVIPVRQTPILPPGAKDARHFAQHCTACQLCVAECPNDVLRPSTDMAHFMQPVMSYERGYCRPECHRCSDVCPTGAISLVDSTHKVATKIGQAHWVKKNCVNVCDHVDCDNCSRHCPAGAIEMVQLDEEDMESPFVPMVDETRCIGCGACEHLCPARPQAAIIVEGVEQQHEI